MATEIVSVSHTVGNAETLIATLASWHPKLSVYVDPKNDPRAIGTRWNLYAVAGTVRTLLASGQYTFDDQASQRVIAAADGGGTTIALYAVTDGLPTSLALKAVMVGWDPAELIVPETEAVTGTHTILTANTTFATLSTWHPLVDVLVDASVAGAAAIGTL